MDVILVPGFWLGANSWDEVVPVIEAAGHRPRALTLPGLDSADTDRSQIGLSDHVDAVVAAIDEADAPVALVGHSGGGPIAYGAGGPDPVVPEFPMPIVATAGAAAAVGGLVAWRQRRMGSASA